MEKTINGSNVAFTQEQEEYLHEGSGYLDRIKESNVLPFSNLKIFFSDDTWDFSSMRTINIHESSLRFRFSEMPPAFKDELKKYILYKLLDNNMKIQSLQVCFGALKRFFVLAEMKSYYAIKHFDDDLIESFLNSIGKHSKSYRRQNAKALRDFLSYYAICYEDIRNPSINALIDDENFVLTPMELELRKVPDIPSSYYNAFLNAALSLIERNETPFHIKSATCILLILSQTGLRISEILNLEYDCLKKSDTDSETELYYLTYKTWKREKGNNVFSVERIFANEITRKAYNLLIDLYADKRPDGCKYLYLGNLQVSRKHHPLPIVKEIFSQSALSVYAYMNRFFQTIDLPQSNRNGLSACEIKKHYQLKKYLSVGKTLAYPTTIQFRVHVCSELYARGCPLGYIQRFMGHLSNEMAGYYVRTKSYNTQEDLEYASSVFKKIVLSEARLLGADAKSLTERIHSFITAKGFRVEKDLDSIVSMLTDKMPVRQKTGGVCIRSSGIRECGKDAETNEFYCAYGVCPNIFHFFYMADVSYRQGKELVETISLNQKRGFLRQAYKESIMLNSLAAQKLIPELDELKYEISRSGSKSLINKYPDLECIISMFDFVYSEALEWKEYSI